MRAGDWSDNNMAGSERFRAMEVFWSRDESDAEDPLIQLQAPGVKDPGNRRPTRVVKVKGRKTVEVKASIPLGRRPATEVMRKPVKMDKKAVNKENEKSAKDEGSRKHQRKASLKELCSEDKRRVANLVNELARGKREKDKADSDSTVPAKSTDKADSGASRVGDEKVRVTHELNSEKLQLEKQIKELVEQQERVLRERQAVQQQLWECQHLLSRYQKMVSNQQEALNRSFTEDLENQPLPPEDSREVSSRHQPGVIDPRRQHYSQNVDAGKFIASPKQNTNVHPPSNKASNTSVRIYKKKDDRHPDLATPQKQTCGIPPLNLDGQGGEGPEFQLTPRGTRVRVPSTGNEHRPFTTLIDGLIAEEKSLSQQTSRSSSPRTASECAPSKRSAREKVHGIGPLHPPVLSSTQQSEMLSVSHQSRTKPGEFQPLPPDPSPRSSLQSASMFQEQDFQRFSNQHAMQPHGPAAYPEFTQYGHHRVQQSGSLANGFHPDNIPQEVTEIPAPGHIVYSGNQARPDLSVSQGTRVTFDERPLLSPNIPHHPAHELSDEDFVNYYKSMTPQERQRHLQSQKAALLTEQQRLRQILEHQERLLRAKQTQLHLQQDMQSQRLQHFQQTGSFPSQPESPVNRCHPLDQGRLEAGIRHKGDPRQPVYNPEEGRHLALMNNEDSDSYGHQMPQPLAKRPHSPAREGSPRDPMFPQIPQHQVAKPSRDDTNSVTESFENLMFLERHGINIAEALSPNKPTIAPVRKDNILSEEDIELEAMTALLNKPHQRSPINYAVGGNKNQSNEGVRSRPGQSASKHRRPTSDQAAQLLDIVDEVESVHNRSHGRTSPSHKYHDFSLDDQGPTDTGVEEDEESRILEEVFFVR